MVTLTSSFFTPGISPLIRYSLSVSLMSTEGAQSATASMFWPDSLRAKDWPKIRFKRLETSSSSLKGSHLTRFMTVLLFERLQNNPRANYSQPGRILRHKRWQNSRNYLHPPELI